MTPGINTELPFDLSTLSHGAFIALIAALIIYAALFIYAAIALARFPQPQLQGLSKLMWALVLIFGNVIGTIVVLVVIATAKKNLRLQQRQDNPSAPAPTGTSSRGAVIADLYGQPRS